MSSSIALLDGGFLPQVEGFLRRLRSLGVSYQVTSTRRSFAEQARLYADWLRGRRALPALPPGQSRHNSGCAIDIVFPTLRELQLAVEVAREKQIRWAGASDPVHFEPADRMTCPVFGRGLPLSGFPNVLSRGSEAIEFVRSRLTARKLASSLPPVVAAAVLAAAPSLSLPSLSKITRCSK